jgi:hypothetical protein
MSQDRTITVQTINAKAQTLERIRARQTMTVFVRSVTETEPGRYTGDGFTDDREITNLKLFATSDPKSTDEMELVLKRLSAERLNPELRAGYQAMSDTNHETVLVIAALKNKEAREQLDEYRREKGMPPRPDEDYGVQITDFATHVQTEFLARAMVSPTLEEIGGIESIPDLAPVLFEAIVSNFQYVTRKTSAEYDALEANPVPRTVTFPEEVEAKTALAESFRANPIEPISRAVEEVRTPADVVGPAAGLE